MPERLQRRREKGWRKPRGAIYVGRPTLFGNPYEARDFGNCAPQLLVDLFRDWIKTDDFDAIQLRRALPTLRGKNLLCWCPVGQPCHADVLLELANAPVCEAVP